MNEINEMLLSRVVTLTNEFFSLHEKLKEKERELKELERDLKEEQNMRKAKKLNPHMHLVKVHH